MDDWLGGRHVAKRFAAHFARCVGVPPGDYLKGGGWGWRARCCAALPDGRRMTSNGRPRRAPLGM